MWTLVFCARIGVAAQTDSPRQPKRVTNRLTFCSGILRCQPTCIVDRKRQPKVHAHLVAALAAVIRVIAPAHTAYRSAVGGTDTPSANFIGSADLAAHAAVVHIGGGVYLTAVRQTLVTVCKVGLASTKSAGPAHAGASGIGKRSTRLATTTAVTHRGGCIGLAAVAYNLVAVTKASIAAADRAVAGRARDGAIGNRRTLLATCAAVAHAGCGIHLAAIDGTGLAGATGSRTHGADAAARRTGRIGGTDRSAGVAAVATVGQVAGAVCLTAVHLVAVAVQIGSLASQAALAQGAHADAIGTILTNIAALAAVVYVARAVDLAAIGRAGVAVLVTTTAGRSPAHAGVASCLAVRRRRALDATAAAVVHIGRSVRLAPIGSPIYAVRQRAGARRRLAGRSAAQRRTRVTGARGGFTRGKKEHK